MSKHNFPKHRYKHGKQTKGIELSTFSKMLEKVDRIDTGKYPILLVKALSLYCIGPGCARRKCMELNRTSMFYLHAKDIVNLSRK